jgi:hypothetical protein
MAAWGRAAAAQDGRTDVPWQTLTFSASKWFNSVDTQIELSKADASEATAAAVQSNQGQPMKAANKELRRIKIHTTIDPAIGTTVDLKKEFWFDPHKNNVLFGESRRTGQDEYLRRFRFTRQGVYRFRSEPVSRQEAVLAPENWSDTKASFYAYSPQQVDCRQVLEPSALIYLINKVNFESSNQSPAFCVFHKRQLYSVTLHDGGTQRVDVDYRVQYGQKTDDVRKQISARRMLLKAVPLGGYRGEVEDFSFLGFKKDIEFLFDPSVHLPVMISGQVPTLGHSVLKLKAARLTQ